jgi:hypothetical protein
MSESLEPTPSTPQDAFTDLIDTIKAPSVRQRPARQGLPTEYRMRHDTHYVEELGARPRLADQAATPSPESVPISAVLRDLCQEFEGLGSCFNLIDKGPRPLRERLGLALARIGVQRSIRYAQHLRILLEDQYPIPRDVRLDDLMRDGFSDLKDELRLTESTLVFDGPPAAVSGDAALLRIALRACCSVGIALAEMAGTPGDLHVLIFPAGDLLHCEFRQESCQLDAQQVAQLFDIDIPERANGRAIAVALNAARRIAQLHGGHLEARRSSSGGCTLIVSLPKAAPPKPN